MPVCISAYGDEYDKDIALSIRYAIDNGANIINMSFSKPHSANSQWIFDAIKYAAKKDVLIITSAGNTRDDLDVTNIYPNDDENNTGEVADNFMKIGASTYHLDENLVASFSNYGKNNVDIFAPGIKIYTTTPHSKYDYSE